MAADAFEREAAGDWIAHSPRLHASGRRIVHRDIQPVSALRFAGKQIRSGPREIRRVLLLNPRADEGAAVQEISGVKLGTSCVGCASKDARLLERRQRIRRYMQRVFHKTGRMPR